MAVDSKGNLREPVVSNKSWTFRILGTEIVCQSPDSQQSRRVPLVSGGRGESRVVCAWGRGGFRGSLSQDGTRLFFIGNQICYAWIRACKSRSTRVVSAGQISDISASPHDRTFANFLAAVKVKPKVVKRQHKHAKALASIPAPPSIAAPTMPLCFEKGSRWLSMSNPQTVVLASTISLMAQSGPEIEVTDVVSNEVLRVKKGELYRNCNLRGGRRNANKMPHTHTCEKNEGVKKLILLAEGLFVQGSDTEFKMFVSVCEGLGGESVQLVNLEELILEDL